MGNKPAVLILSAGFSSRMGIFKPLLPFLGQSALEYVIDQVKQAGIERIFVVVGHKKEKLEALILGKGAKPCFNEQYSEGMFTSVKRGIKEAFGDVPFLESEEEVKLPCGFLLHPVDCPLIPTSVYEALLKQIEYNPEQIAVASYNGKNGHPLYIPKRLIPDILSYSGEEGMKYFTKKYADSIVKVEVENQEILWDMDEIFDYQRMCLYLKSKNKENEITRRKIYLIRHGEILQHEAPILLGQTDVELSEKGREQAEESGKALAEMAPSLTAVYSSDLKRARDTAQIVIKQYEKNLSLTEKKDLRELALGDWDGKLVEEIREMYGEEFEKRGEDLLRYKISGGGENFFELQERAVRCLETIIKETEGEIALVTHGGVIRTIIADLLHLSLAELVDIKIKNGQILTILWPPC